MKLAAYLEKHGVSRVDFAARVGVTAEAIRLYMAGERQPRRKVMEAITRESSGEVTANDFYSVEAAG